MCQPKPGPRCASHTHAALVRAQAAAETASADRAAAQERFEQACVDQRRASRGPDSTAADARVAQATADLSAASAASTAADEALVEATQAYDATPQGQRALTERVTALATEGRYSEAYTAQVALDRAQATHARQKDDLAAAREQARRLDGPVPPDDARAIDEAALSLERAEARLTGARSHEQQAQTDVDAATTTAQAAESAYRSGAVRVSEAAAAVHATVPAARDRIVALYRAQGIDGGTAARLADRSVLDQRPHRDSEPSAHPVVYDVRAAGVDRPPPTGALTPALAAMPRPLREASMRAQQAAADDETLRAANARLTDAAKGYAAARQDLQSVLEQRVIPSTERVAATTRILGQARMALQDAQAARSTAADAAARTKAKVGAGLPARAAEVPLPRAAATLTRLPDGGTNAWHYEPPVDGLPNGRYQQVRDVAHGGDLRQPSLVLADGSQVRATTTTYPMAFGREVERTHVPHVLLVPLPEAAAAADPSPHARAS